MPYVLATTFAFLSVLGFTILYITYRACLPFLPENVIICLQSFLSWVCILPWVLRHGTASVVSPQVPIICLRGVFGFGAALCLVHALTTTPLAETTLLTNSAPLIIPFIAHFWLKQKMKVYLWPGIITGFIGILVMMNPTVHLQTGYLFALLSGLFTAAIVVVVQRIAHEPLHRVLFYYFACFWVPLFPLLFTEWVSPPGFVWWLLALGAVSAVAGQILFAMASRYAAAVYIASFLYLIPLFSLVADWVFWQETITGQALLGMIIIISSGLYVLFMMRKKQSRDAIVLIEPIGSGVFLKDTVRTLNYQVIAVFPNSDSYYRKLYAAKGGFYANCDVVIRERQMEAILHKIRKTKYRIKACITGTEGGVEMADQISAALGLFGNPLETVVARRDKGEMRKWLAQSNLTCPQFMICSSRHEVEQFAKDHSFPLVVKTPKGMGAMHVFICKDLTELLRRFHEITQTENVTGEQAREAVVEEYIGGEEYVVDTFSDGKEIHVTDVWIGHKISIGHAPHVSYDSIIIPLTDPIAERLSAYAKDVVAHFRVERGPSHLEIRDDPQKGPVLIEIASRLAGIMIPHIIQKHTNFDAYFSTVDVLVNGTTQISTPIVYTKYPAVVFCPILHSGRVISIQGLEEIQKLPSYESHVLYVRIGDVVSSSSELFGLPAKVFLANADYAQLLQDVESVHRLFVIQTAP